MANKRKKSKCILLIMGIVLLSHPITANAQPNTFEIPRIGIEVGEAQTPRDIINTFEILFVFTILTLAPSILIMMTSFTRIVIVLSFIRNALELSKLLKSSFDRIGIIFNFFIMAPGDKLNRCSTAI